VSTPTKTAEGAGALDRYFELSKRGTTVRTEVVAGLTTFLAMAYIMALNPIILSDAGMDFGAVFAATALAAGIGSLVMGVWGKLPIAQAPGMGLNAFFAITVVGTLGIPWQTALAGTLVSGVLFLILAVTGLRRAVINAIPMPIKLAVGAGIGLFIAFIGLKEGGIIEDAPIVLVGLGNLGSTKVQLALFGIVITAIMLARGIRGAVLYGIIGTTVVGVLVGFIAAPEQVFGPIPSLAPTFGVAFSSLPDLLSLDLAIVVFAMLFVDFFDTAGTLIAVTKQANLLTPEGELPNGNRPLVSDAVATIAGAALGTSTTTSYIESSSGVGAGGRTGLTSVTTSVLFFAMLFLQPLIFTILDHREVTTAALVLVGLMMARPLGEIVWDRWEIAVPAFAAVIMMPLTYNIAYGIAFALILYPVMMVARGKAREVSVTMYVLALLFILYFVIRTVSLG
jgi:AGZA family xanthine/uracil permease-like MFS transporter